MNDPMIGRDVLVGVAWGAMGQVVTLGVRILERSAGLLTEPARLSTEMLVTMTGAAAILSQVCYAMASGFLMATWFFILLVIFRAPLGSPWGLGVR